MPLSDDSRLNELAGDILKQQRNLAGEHPGYRPVHAKGIYIGGTFTPTPAAGVLSTAPHFNAASTPVTVRFSDGTGLPSIPDNSPDATPAGCGVRFHLGPHQHTDIVAHSINLFPGRTGEEMLGLFTALGKGGDAPGEFLAAHPAAARFVTAPKPIPASFAGLEFFAINAFHLVATAGTTTVIRYRIMPEDGLATLTEDEAKAQGTEYLFDEIKQRLAPGGKGVALRFQAQLAGDGDPEDDATVVWPEDRQIVELGTIRLEQPLPSDDTEQKRLIFDPVPRVKGIEPSSAPLLAVRGDVYLLSGKKRRQEAGV